MLDGTETYEPALYFGLKVLLFSRNIFFCFQAVYLRLTALRGILPARPDQFIRFAPLCITGQN